MLIFAQTAARKWIRESKMKKVLFFIFIWICVALSAAFVIYGILVRDVFNILGGFFFSSLTVSEALTRE